MEDLALRIRLSVLWLVFELTAVLGLILEIFEPGVIEQLIAGEIDSMQTTPELLLVMAIGLLIPLVMAVLSLTLKDSKNRWANIILGIAFVVFPRWIGYLARPSAYYMHALGIAGMVFSALIVWYAWKWKV